MISNILLQAHPVGSYYWSADSTSPETLFGGTWEQIKDKFIIAVGDSHTVGTSYGSNTKNISHTHSISHTHGVPGVAHTHTSAAHTHTTGNHTLTAAESGVPAHNHGASSGNAGDHSHIVYLNNDSNFPFIGYPGWSGGTWSNAAKLACGSGSYSGYNFYAGNSGTHNHSVSVSNNTASSASSGHNHGNTGSTTPGATGSTTPSSTTTNSQSTTTSGSGGSTSLDITPACIAAYCWRRTA